MSRSEVNGRPSAGWRLSIVFRLWVAVVLTAAWVLYIREASGPLVYAAVLAVLSQTAVSGIALFVGSRHPHKLRLALHGVMANAAISGIVLIVGAAVQRLQQVQ